MGLSKTPWQNDNESKALGLVHEITNQGYNLRDSKRSNSERITTLFLLHNNTLIHSEVLLYCGGIYPLRDFKKLMKSLKNVD